MYPRNLSTPSKARDGCEWRPFLSFDQFKMSRATLPEITPETQAPGFQYSYEIDGENKAGEGKVSKHTINFRHDAIISSKASQMLQIQAELTIWLRICSKRPRKISQRTFWAIELLMLKAKLGRMFGKLIVKLPQESKT